MKPRIPLAGVAAVSLVLALAACGGDDESSGTDAAAAHGPITIWYSNNAQEVAWGKQMVDAWNSRPPDREGHGAGDPGRQVLRGGHRRRITAGTAPCLIYNTSPAAVPGFQKQGGLVRSTTSPTAPATSRPAAGKPAEQYKSPDGKYYQLPWKSNPVMIFYNKKIFAKAGISTTDPPLATYAEFLATVQEAGVVSGAAKYAIYPAPSSEFFQSWFDFYPLFAAETGGSSWSWTARPRSTPTAGGRSPTSGSSSTRQNLAGKEAYNGDSFADGNAAMAIVGPWAIAAYKGKVDWGVVLRADPGRHGRRDQSTFSDAKNVAMYTACENRGTAWDFLKFSTSKEQDGKLLEMTGQMPHAAGPASSSTPLLRGEPAVQAVRRPGRRTRRGAERAQLGRDLADLPRRLVKSVIFGKEDPNKALTDAAHEDRRPGK